MNSFKSSKPGWKRICPFLGWWLLLGRETLRKGGYVEEFGSGNVFQSKGEAITAIFEKLDRERCCHCDKRIFSECTAVEYVELPHEPAR